MFYSFLQELPPKTILVEDILKKAKLKDYQMKLLRGLTAEKALILCKSVNGIWGVVKAECPELREPDVEIKKKKVVNMDVEDMATIDLMEQQQIIKRELEVRRKQELRNKGIKDPHKEDKRKKNTNEHGKTICPYCEDEIEILEHEEKELRRGNCTLEGIEDLEFEYMNNLEDIQRNYCCPSCAEVLTDDYDEAVKILKGQYEIPKNFELSYTGTYTGTLNIRAKNKQEAREKGERELSRLAEEDAIDRSNGECLIDDNIEDGD